MQEIIVYIILTFVFAYSIFKIVRFFYLRRKDPCNGCSSGCAGCAVAELKKEIEKKQAEKAIE